MSSLSLNAPDVSYFAKIDPMQFARQGWEYAVRLHLPTGARAELEGLLKSSITDPKERAAMSMSLKDGLTVLIPYVQEMDTLLPAALNITYLLEGDKHIEHRGRVRGQQTISGTSGFLAAMPHGMDKITRSRAGSITALQNLITEGGSLTELGERSGYGWFHRFVRIFELYWLVKRLGSAAVARATKFIWLNTKDDQLMVIEPSPLRWRRSARQDTFTYKWTFSFEVIENFKGDVDVINGPISPKKLDTYQEILAGKNALVQQINNLSALLTKGTDIVIQAVKVFMEPINGLIEIADAVSTVASTLLRETGRLATEILNTGAGVFEAFDRIGLGSDNAIVKAFNQVYISVTMAAERVIQAFHKMLAPRPWMKREKERQRYQGGTPSEKYGIPTSDRSSEENARNSVVRNPSAVDPAGIGTSPYGTGMVDIFNRHVEGAYEDQFKGSYNTARLGIIMPGDTIFDVAKREMGDARSWHTLVLENDLQPPYIVTPGRDTMGMGRVLRQGDRIRIPTWRSESSPILDYYFALTNQEGNRIPQFTGFAQPSIGSNITITDPARTTLEKMWTPGALRGFQVSIVAGTGYLEQRVVRDNTEDTISLSLQGQLADFAAATATTVRLEEGQGVKFPSQGPLYFNYNSPFQVDAYLTSRDGDVLTFEPPLAAPLPKGTSVDQIDNPFSFIPDATTQYLLWLDQVPDLDPPPLTPDMALGLDFKLVRDPCGDLDMVQGPQGDAATVTGLEALVQSLRIVMDTRIGANPFLPEDGVPNIIGRKATSQVLILYLMYVRKALLDDPRVVDITRESVNTGNAGDVVGLDVTVLTVGGFEVTVGVGQSSTDFPSV